MSACVTCGSAVENPAHSGLLCLRCFDADQKSDSEKRSILGRIPLALFLSLVPFCAHVRETYDDTTEVNGVVETHTRSIDYIPLVFGPLAVLVGLWGIKSALSGAPEARMKNIAFSALAILIGGWQITRGIT